ncbi:hypothetical protein EDB85DRAFT_2273372 [Lactarius pseudohatsudake]|nr:hypothetical protein EDB85DRAFT_2273372 [Lactarius pseudohatsudake]
MRGGYLSSRRPTGIQPQNIVKWLYTFHVTLETSRAVLAHARPATLFFLDYHNNGDNMKKIRGIPFKCPPPAVSTTHGNRLTVISVPVSQAKEFPGRVVTAVPARCDEQHLPPHAFVSTRELRQKLRKRFVGTVAALPKAASGELKMLSKCVDVIMPEYLHWLPEPESGGLNNIYDSLNIAWTGPMRPSLSWKPNSNASNPDESTDEANLNIQTLSRPTSPTQGQNQKRCVGPTFRAGVDKSAHEIEAVHEIEVNSLLELSSITPALGESG